MPEKISKKRKNTARTLLSAACTLALLGVLALIMINRFVVVRGTSWLVTGEQALELGDVDCILVLGAGVYANKYPSPILRDRLEEGVELYRLGASERILMSGDNGQVSYNEVQVMKSFAVDAGVPSGHVFRDHAGFSTYESMYRAGEVFAARRVIVVTQGYHMYRALYIARALGLEAYGVPSDPREYAGQPAREVREFLARIKDAAYCVFKPLPTYLGDVIPVGGDADLIN